MLRAGHILQLTVIAMLGLAVVMIHSAAMRVADEQQISMLAMFGGRHAAHALLAVSAMYAASRINIRQFQRIRGGSNPLWWLMGAAIFLVALAMVPGVGRSVHGASRWLRLSPRSWGLSFQPSELVKWLMVIFLAWWCAGHCVTIRHLFRGLGPPLLIIALATGLVALQDLGTAALIGLVALLLLVAGGAALWQLGLLLPPAAAAVTVAIMAAPFRVQRLTAFIDPWADPQGAGYHPIQSLIAISGGGLTGKGLGAGVQKFGYLPEDTTDFLFAVICEELGLAGAALVIVLLLTLLWTGLSILRNARDTFARLFIGGVLLTVGIQAVINIAVVTVMMPTKGIALPLLSAGGTGWVLTAASLGLVASLDTPVARDTPEVEGILLDEPFVHTSLST